ncbi:MAG: Bax inhibitor-1/YccA family protein [Vicinamibacterales bacterium]
MTIGTPAYTFPFRTMQSAWHVSAFMQGVYAWMAGGLALTAVTVWVIATSRVFSETFAFGRLPFWSLAIVQLGLVVLLSSRVERLTSASAGALFIAYSALTGVTLSFVRVAYTGGAVATSLLIAAGMFVGLSLYGAATGRSLAGMRQFLFMSLIGVVLASTIGIFWHSEGSQFVLSMAGVLIFAGLAACDAQRLSDMADAVPLGHAGSSAIRGALALSLDFVDLFLSLFRMPGRGRASTHPEKSMEGLLRAARGSEPAVRAR